MEQVVEKVLKEMEKAEKTLIEWKAYWKEIYTNCYVDDITRINCDRRVYRGNSYDEIYASKLGLEFLKIDPFSIIREPRSSSLKNLVSNGNHECQVNTILWKDIRTNNSVRQIEFNSDGNISLTKKGRHSQNMCYESSYNVGSSNFTFDIEIPHIDDIIISASDKLFEIKHSNMDIINNLDKNTKTIVIKCINNRGKVNKTYVFKIDNQNNIFIKCYSREGRLLFKDTFTNLMINSSMEELCIPLLLQNLIQESLKQSATDLDLVSVLNDFEMYCINILKGLKGEIPLTGLVKRIDCCVSTIESKLKANDIGIQKINRRKK